MFRFIFVTALSAVLCACGGGAATSSPTPSVSVPDTPSVDTPVGGDETLPDPLLPAVEPGPEPPSAVVAPGNPAKPNLVLIMTDDQTVRDLAAMPWTLKLLRNEGVAFTNSFVSWPLCCPSRATAFSGVYAHNHGVLGNYPPDGAAQAFTTDSETLPVWLQRAGYATIHIGKYLNGYGADRRGSTYVPPGWTDWMGLVDPTTYRMWGYKLNHNGVLTTYGDESVEDPKLYQTDVLTKLALDAIDRAAATGNPFFLSFAPLAPHEEIPENPPPGTFFPGPRPAPRHAGSLSWVPLPQVLGFDESDLSDKPAIIPALGALWNRETMANRVSRYQRRLEALRAVDEAVWWIMVKLKVMGALDNTWIVFTSDNGWFNGEHHLDLGKYLMYEPSIRVPLLVRGPGVIPGTLSSELVANVDLAATFVDLAGATPGRVIDGRSLVPFIHDPNLVTTRPILLDAPHDQLVSPGANPTDIPAMRGLRTRRFKYVEYGTGEVELYDLVSDPGEMNSRHADPNYAAARTALHTLLQQYQGCVGDTCRAGIIPPN
ncbi:MAG TPA: sulfatase [Nevskiaceae bacterium]|nr:sulfatase [Nevskiaceae bacterium]